MKKLFLIFLIPICAFAKGEHDEHGKATSSTHPEKYLSSEASSDKYEAFIKYDPITAGEKSILRLFISEFLTNKPLDSATLAITVQEDKTIKLTIERADKGYFEISGVFPEEKKYSLAISLNSSLGPDLLLLQNIEPGKELEGAEEDAESVFANPTIVFLTGMGAGLIIMFVFMSMRYRKVATVFLALMLSLPTATFRPATAHEGHDNGNSKGNNFSNGFDVPKETQFLFNVFTQPVKPGQFRETTKLFGTVIPASNGQAVVQSPQTGKISQLIARVGQKVNKGELLAVIEPSLDAGSTVSLLTEKNNVNAELDVAKKEYERLKSVEDIAAKRDVAEAEARYIKAKENKILFEQISSGKGNTGAIFLRAPITGIVGNFTYAIGSTVNANESILSITDLSHVYVEAQVFDKDADQVSSSKNFLVECANADEHKTAEVKLLAPAQSINPTNQTQRVIFEMENPEGDFKIGEFVNVRVFASQPSREMALPNSAITEINGRPVVFIKDSAEEYSLSYITTGQNNGTHTIIHKGIEEGERVVVNSTYQMKMIYLNQ